MQDNSGTPQGVAQYNPSALVSQNNSLLGNTPTATAGQGFNPQMLNTTAFQSSPEVANMIKALKGNSNG